MSDADLESLLQRTPVEEPSPKRRAELRSRVLDEFDKSRRNADASFAHRLWKKGKRIMVHPITRTAALAAAVVLCLWAFSPTPAIAAFDDLVKPLVQAKSATYKIVASIEGHPDTTGKGFFLAPNRTRQEIGEIISISDQNRGKMMSLTPSARQALVFDLAKAPAGASGNHFGDLRKMLEGLRGQTTIPVRELPEKEIGGRKAFGFSFVQAGATMELWADVETKRVLRIEMTSAGPPPSTIVMTDFEFDVPLDEKLFSVDPPEGYKVIKANVKPGVPTETEFTAALKKFTEMSGGELPAGFDGASMGMSFAEVFAKDAKDEKQVGDELMQTAMELGRGFAFATIQSAEADAQYAGRGVKTGGEPKPIFWYKPKGEGKYRVLSTDWKWTESETAPSVPNAIKLGGFPKSAMKNGK